MRKQIWSWRIADRINYLNYIVYIGVDKENFNLCRIIKVRFPINHFTCSLYENRIIIIEVIESAALVFYYRIQGKKEGVDFDHQKSWNPNDLAAEG